MSEPLKPCPFCGNTAPHFERTGTHRHSCIVECGNCGCRHESGDEEERSGASWNIRADDAELTALREKCEELQAKLNTAIDALDDANEGIARRQSQLDEAAKQKPEIYVAAIHIRAAQENGECKTVIYGDDEHVHHVAPLYRHPPNLPALIEQAEDKFADELLHILQTNYGIDTSNWDGDEGLVHTLAKCISLDIGNAKTEERDRLDFVLTEGAFLYTRKSDSGTDTYQLWTQDEDEEFHVLHDKEEFFSTPVDAVDAAIRARSGK